MRRVVSLILAAVIFASLFASCSEKKKSAKKADTGMHTLYFKDSNKSKKVSATFFNSLSEKSTKVKMKKVSEDKDSVTFSCEGNCKLYNMAYITYDDKKTDEFAFNKCVSGWNTTDVGLLPYAEGEKIDHAPKFKAVTLKAHGFNKNVHIWTPDDYDAESKDKYSTVYVLDGERMAFIGKEYQGIEGSELVTEQVKAMTASTGTKAIVVAIENAFGRDNELTPMLGSFPRDEYDNMNGTQFADFLANTLVPYVREHYNVYDDALHTSVTGASLGGLESFYITTEYPEVFGTAGALSPSFMFVESEAWDEYLGGKKFTKSSPFLYLYTGNSKDDTDPFVTDMYKRLLKLGYPKDKLCLHYNDKGAHSSIIWRNMFSEFLTAMVFRKVEPLQKK